MRVCVCALFAGLDIGWAACHSASPRSVYNSITLTGAKLLAAAGTHFVYQNSASK